VYRSFSWQIPEYYNIGVDICDKHAAVKNRTALIYELEDGRVDRYTFDDFIKLSNQFANVLTAAGMTREDRVGILLPQCPETAIAHRIALDGDKKDVTVLFSDLRDFTPMTESHDPKLVVKIMNSYFNSNSE